MIENEAIKNTLEEKILKYAEQAKVEYSIEDLFAYMNEIEFIHKENLEKGVWFDEKLDLIKMALVAISKVALIFSDEKNIFNKSWKNLNVEGAMLTVSALLAQIVNGLESISILIKQGFDYQARIIVRNVEELCLLTIVLIYDEKMLNEYLENKNPKSFEPRALRDRVNEIEKELLMLNNVVEELKRNRRSMYQQYSKVVHNNFPYPIEASFVPLLEPMGDQLELCIFGKLTTYSIGTIETVTANLFVFLGLLFKGVAKHDMKQVREDATLNELLYGFFILNETYREFFIQFLSENENIVPDRID